MDPNNNGQELAFPFVETREMQGESISFGLTKREVIAKDVLAALAPSAIGGYPCTRKDRLEACAKDALDITDALLRALAAGGEE